eukprot:Gregarina_sp_Pseudo_9__785@NODE_1500_length_1541_cov_5_779627_g1390_i0_p1_GENE_NODE_1500_length_1541_cov_5_779627_g1390_i0NODE_1500_length_1541_cov_5_779627_g1390_i0_p1_ORF_typecomplete_len249_score4_29DUF3672/PF12421_8/0_022_NODE_1500_length_1541_cov_5_779627_g1390_i0206952
MTNIIGITFLTCLRLARSAPVYIRHDSQQGALLCFSGVYTDYSWEKRSDTLSFYDKSKEILSYSASRNNFTIHRNCKVIGVVVGEQLQGDYYLVDLETFDEATTAWENSRISTCGVSSDIFLGGHCKYSYHTTSRTYTQLPAHRSLRVTGRLHFMGKWEGQAIKVSVDGAIAGAYPYHWCPGIFESRCQSLSTSECGALGGEALSKFFSVEVPHSEAQMKLAIESTLSTDTDPCVVSWGVDDIAIHVK